ncbi:MAG: hypothetical protein JWO12_2231 [Frankiales bacterium]|nr:hypothetical protein [Frankiales bacterium]
MTEPYLTRLQSRMARGDSLEEAAERYGLELWRAKATFVRAGLEVPAPVRRRKPVPDEVKALGARIHSYLLREDNASTTQIAEALGVTQAEVAAAVWPGDEPKTRPAFTTHDRYPRESILLGLRGMSLVLGRERQARGGVPVTAAYWDAHRDPEVQPPASVIRYRFGTWAAACREAGIPLSKAETADTARRWTDEECLDAVRRFFAGGHGWTSAHYGRWYKDNDAPSQLTIVARLGPWPALRDRVLG